MHTLLNTGTVAAAPCDNCDRPCVNRDTVDTVMPAHATGWLVEGKQASPAEHARLRL